MEISGVHRVVADPAVAPLTPEKINQFFTILAGAPVESNTPDAEGLVLVRQVLAVPAVVVEGVEGPCGHSEEVLRAP